MRTYRYLVRRSFDGELLDLGRVVEDDEGLDGETYLDGEWIDDPTMTQILFGPGAGEWIDEAEVESCKEAIDLRLRRLRA